MARLGRLTSWFTKLVCTFGIRPNLILALIPLLWIGSSPRSEAQAFNAAAISGQVSTPTGQVAVNARVRICAISAAGFPCTPTSQVFADDNLTILLPNPISTDQYGNYKAFVKAGLYLVQVSLGGSGAQPTYTYYVSAGAGGALSAAPPYSIQFASPSAGQFNSDPLITIDPTNHIVTSPEFYSPGSGTGIIEIAGAISGSAVTLTVDPNTQAWTFTLPSQVATVNGACLTSTTAGVTSWSAGCGNPSVAPVNSVQIASSTPGLFNSDPTTTINPTTHLFSSPDINNSYVASSSTSIAAALTAAGTTAGSVTIPGGYTGTAGFIGSSKNTRVFDQRPFNPGNVATFSNQIEPGTTIKASEFGALCNGVADDWPAINAAVNALTDIVGITQVDPQAMNAGTVELPQGRCGISQPIVLTNYGSIQGSANGTWLTPTSAWSGGDAALIQITQSYNQSSYLSQGITTINRFVRGINFFYNTNGHNITGIQVINPTGHTSAQPYPVSAQFALYQLPGVIIEGNTFFAMDTAIDLEDCGECVIENNQIFFVRLGILDFGNNYSLRVEHNSIQAGSYEFTHTLTGATIGIFSALQTRWIVVSSVPTQSLVVSPQGLDVGETIITTFDQNARIVNCQGCDFHDTGFDFGGDGGQGTGVPNPSVYVGDLNQVQFHHDYFASAQTNGVGMEIADSNSTPVDTLNTDGLWITDSYFQNYTNTGVGISYDTGTNGRRNNWIERDQFSHMANWIVINQPLSYSTIKDNYGFFLSGSAITFNATGSTAFTDTVVSGNTTSDAVNIITDTTGSGYLTGYNQAGPNNSVVQLTGSFTATGTGCSITGGAIGDTCSVTMNNQIPFGDTAYIVTGCSITAPSNPAHMGYVTTPTLGTQFAVAEVADSTSAVSGGTVACTVVHK